MERREFIKSSIKVFPIALLGIGAPIFLEKITREEVGEIMTFTAKNGRTYQLNPDAFKEVHKPKMVVGFKR